MMFGTFQGLSQFLRTWSPSGRADECSCDVVFENRGGQIYNEEAFRYFLNNERRRAEHAQRTCVLVLVSFKRAAGSAEIPRRHTPRLFSALTRAVREIDYIGWYRDHRIAGAVLVQGTEPPGADAARHLRQRVAAILQADLPRSLAERVVVRVVALRGGVNQ